MEKKESFIEAYIRKLTIRVFTNFDKNPPKVEDWYDFLESLPKSKDPFVLSENKYKCRMYYFDWKYKLLINTNSFFVLTKTYIKNFLFKLFKKRDNDYIASDRENYDMIILNRRISIDDVFPKELFKEFPKYKKVETRHDRTIIFNQALKESYKILARKNRFNFSYKLLALREFALHSYVLENYNPKATVVYVNERNTLSPIIKDIYEKKNKEFIGFMHGTDLLHLIKSYMSFSRYYIWDEDYIDMYINDMNCNINKYIVHKPDKLKKEYFKKEKYDNDLTYYLSATSTKSLKKLSEIVKQLKEKNINIKFRAHPRIPGLNNIINILGEDNMEKTDIGITESISNTEYVVGLSTTVIEEAFYGGKKIILDDITDEEMFKNLKDRKYLMLKKEHILFSDYLKDIDI